VTAFLFNGATSIFLLINEKLASVNYSTSTRTMVKKVVDSRVHTLIKNCVQTKHRSFFVVVGDRGKDQVLSAEIM
jgi:hypothetical protein